MARQKIKECDCGKPATMKKASGMCCDRCDALERAEQMKRKTVGFKRRTGDGSYQRDYTQEVAA